MNDKQNSQLEKEYNLAWDKYTDEDLEKVFQLSERYIEFMSKCKTERECAREFKAIAEKFGYRDLADLIKEHKALKPGDKVYADKMGKSLALFVIGREPLENGMTILGAHIDSPRLDLKQNPLYEDTDLALLETHYYGGIKKYQWVTMPLAVHGVVVKKDGTCVNIVIGEDENDPVLGVSDLLIHLASNQMSKTLAKGVEGENLNVFAGSIPIKDTEAKIELSKISYDC